jgi:SAM-dependent methyltransferase
MSEPRDRDAAPYVLGTDEGEISRLRLQHDLWQPRVADLWKQAGIGTGHTVLDLGCGPGFAALDLAALVGSAGRVIALDRSRAFLDVLRDEADRRGLTNVETVALDLNAIDRWPIGPVDVVWSRWSLAFVARPRDALTLAVSSLRPGGVLVAQEYLSYEQWQLIPASALFSEFVQQVIAAWRAANGEPDLAAPLLSWLPRLGFDIEVARPVVDVLSPSDPLWRWPRAFVETGLLRLASLGRMTPAVAGETWQSFLAAEADPATRMVTPLTLQIAARKAGR